MLKQPIYRNFNSSTYHIKNLILTPESAKLHYISNWDESLAVHTVVYFIKTLFVAVAFLPNLIFFFFHTRLYARSETLQPLVCTTLHTLMN